MYISKSFIPSDASKDDSVLILDKKKSYRYYELNEDGLNYSNLDGFSNEDSIRINNFILI